ncbi:hypothetical protein F5887DRAFT_918095 [Amanita rubescens]|nr:hypothetical protein F5887DRAFT_918095 [Amanita rubescens]
MFFPDFLQTGYQDIPDEGTSYIGSGSNDFFGFNSSLTTLNPGESSTESQLGTTMSAASERPPYVLNSLGKESAFSIPGGNLGSKVSYDHGSCSRYPDNVAPTSLPPHPITDGDNPGNPSPSLHTASMDVAFFKGPAELHVPPPVPQLPPDRTYVSPTNQHIPRNAVRRASNMRRTRPASHRCFLCGADYTKAHNLNCLSFFTDITSTCTLIADPMTASTSKRAAISVRRRPARRAVTIHFDPSVRLYGAGIWGPYMCGQAVPN